MSVWDEADLERRVRDLLDSDIDGEVYVPPGPMTALQRLADGTGIAIRVSSTVPPETIYLLNRETAASLPADYIVEPRRAD